MSECLKAYKENGEELFGFFNSGQHSGASQAHRHVQFLPVKGMRTGLAYVEEWDVLANKLVESGNKGLHLPFFYSSCSLSEETGPEELYHNYMHIYGQAKQKWDEYEEEKGDAMSYNLAVTDHAIVICPRLAEGTTIKNIDGQDIGPVALNGTLIGGTLLVKSEEEWNAIKKDEAQLKIVLESIGLPSS